MKKYEALVEGLRQFDQVRFLCVARMDELTDRWSMIFGLVNTDDLDSRNRLFAEIRKVFAAELSQEDMNDIARISLFPVGENLIKDIVGYQQGERIEQTKANGNFIHEGYVLISR